MGQNITGQKENTKFLKTDEKMLVDNLSTRPSSESDYPTMQETIDKEWTNIVMPQKFHESISSQDDTSDDIKTL